MFLFRPIFSTHPPALMGIRTSLRKPKGSVSPPLTHNWLVLAASNVNPVTLHNILLQNKLEPFASNNLYIDVVLTETWRLQLGDKLSTSR